MNEAPYREPPSSHARLPIVYLAPPLIMLVLVLFPLGWLGELWQPLGLVIDWLFPTAWAHAIGHASLFGLLGLLALVAAPALRRRPWAYLCLLLLAGVGQESFQVLYKGGLLVFDSVRDLATDLLGGLLAFAVIWGWGWVRGGVHSGTDERYGPQTDAKA